MITVSAAGNFRKTYSFIERLKEAVGKGLLDKYGRIGVDALKRVTPVDTGVTAASWYYTIEQTDKGAKLIFNNANIVDGYSVAIMLEYGHQTGTHGWVEGLDYISPAIEPVFDDLLDELWGEVKRL